MRDFVRPFDERQRRVQHEIHNCAMGGCGLSRCEWVGGLFLGGSQGPCATTDYFPSCPGNLPLCDCRPTLPRLPLCGSCCKCRHVFPGRSSGGNHSAEAIKPLRLVQSSPPRALIKRTPYMWVPTAKCPVTRTNQALTTEQRHNAHLLRLTKSLRQSFNSL
jgi:hypothetical protein